MKPSIPQALQSIALAVGLIAGAAAFADELDDQVKAACTGLSARFNSGSTKSDAIDDEIGKDIDGNADLRALIARARFTGSARTCGSDTKAAEAKLDAAAAAQYPGASPKAKRLVQIVQCTEARNAREAASHWNSPSYCNQAARNFDSYVTHNQPPP